MLYTNVKIKVEALHVPSTTWAVYERGISLRAVSNKDACNKALAIIRTIPAYADRIGLPEWRVEAAVDLVDAITHQYIEGSGWQYRSAYSGKVVDYPLT